MPCRPLNSASVLPKAERCFMYFTAWSTAACAMPTPIAAIAMRPPSSTCMACTNPCPRSPSRWSAGTRASSKISSAVSEACSPSLR